MGLSDGLRPGSRIWKVVSLEPKAVAEVNEYWVNTADGEAGRGRLNVWRGLNGQLEVCVTMRNRPFASSM